MWLEGGGIKTWLREQSWNIKSLKCSADFIMFQWVSIIQSWSIKWFLPEGKNIMTCVCGGAPMLKIRINFCRFWTKIQRNWVFVTNSNCLIPISLQSDDVNIWYFKLRFFILTEFIVWNIKGLRHWVAKI